MKKWMKIVAFLLAMLMLCSAFVACNDEGDTPPADDGDGEDAPPAKTEKEIDVYLIAGQSNAAGSTIFKNDNGTLYKEAEAILEEFPALETGTPYIQYAGNSAGNSPNNSVTYGFRDVGLGLGSSKSKMGPEVGMAYALSSVYNEQTGKHAAIIKYAHGGTGLVRTEANSGTDGNWEPPSYRAHAADDPDRAYRGFLYRGFLEEVGAYLYQLKKDGYTKITLKGLYWMQGCNDTWRYTTGEETSKKSPNWYPEAFACLVKDWRNDLAQIMKDMKMSPASAQNMPFFIGTISATYRMDGDPTNGTVAATEARNLPFIAMQKKLAEDNEKCYIVDNSGYHTMKYEDGQYKVLGTDASHWGVADCYQIGKNVGNAMLENGYK